MDALKTGKAWEAPARTFDEYIRRVEAYLTTAESEADRQYWLSTLTGFVGAGYKADSLAKATLEFAIPEEVTEKLRAFQNESRISSFVLAMGGVFTYYQGLRERLGARGHDMVWDISVNGR